MESPLSNRMKEEFPAESSSRPAAPFAPRPMEGLQDPGPPPFLTKTYEMVDDPSTEKVVSWSKTNNSFVVWDPYSFAMDLLPKNFKHNNFSSFVRQLNTYIYQNIAICNWLFGASFVDKLLRIELGSNLSQNLTNEIGQLQLYALEENTPTCKLQEQIPYRPSCTLRPSSFIFKSPSTLDSEKWTLTDGNSPVRDFSEARNTC